MSKHSRNHKGLSITIRSAIPDLGFDLDIHYQKTKWLLNKTRLNRRTRLRLRLFHLVKQQIHLLLHPQHIRRLTLLDLLV
jgi:hypothetical protein